MAEAIKSNTKNKMKPILAYGVESWQLLIRNRKKLETMEIDFLRSACGISRLKHTPNQKIRSSTNRVHTTVEAIKTKQLDFLLLCYYSLKSKEFLSKIFLFDQYLQTTKNV